MFDGVATYFVSVSGCVDEVLPVVDIFDSRIEGSLESVSVKNR